jgi:hypothetical protein
MQALKGFFFFWAHFRRSAPETGLSIPIPRLYRRRGKVCGISISIPCAVANKRSPAPHFCRRQKTGARFGIDSRRRVVSGLYPS